MGCDQSWTSSLQQSMLSSFPRTKKVCALLTGSSLMVASPRWHIPCTLLSTRVVGTVLCSSQYFRSWAFPLALIFWKCSNFPNGLCPRLKWCTDIAMAAQEKEILTCGIRGSQGKCSLPLSGKHLHVASTTSLRQSNRKSISMSTWLKYCTDTGQLDTSPFTGILTIDPKGMPTFTYASFWHLRCGWLGWKTFPSQWLNQICLDRKKSSLGQGQESVNIVECICFQRCIWNTAKHRAVMSKLKQNSSS